MGTFRVPVQVGRLEGGEPETIEALVDTGATWTWIPRPILDRLGINPSGRRRLELANGHIVERESGFALVTVEGVTVPTLCIFGDAGTTPLLGAVTLEECALAPDPGRRRLLPSTGWLATLPT
ncbi:MAG: retroviral-like aspartic protease family protein [bacterium]